MLASVARRRKKLPARAEVPETGTASAELVRSRVAFALRGLAGLRGLESVLVAIAGFTAGLAAVVQSGGTLEAGAAWIVASICAGLSGGSWGFAHLQTPPEVARAIDLGLEEEGALFTAWELEGRAEPSELGRLLGRDVAGRRTARAMLHAILPATAPVLALPFLAAMALFLALEGTRGDSTEVDLSLLSAKLSDDLSGLRGADAGAAPSGAEDLSQAELAALAQLARDASRTQDAIRRGEVDAREELEALQERLGELESSVPAGSELREELDQAAATIDSALMALDPPPAASEGAGAGAETAAEGSTPGTEVAPEGQDGTIARFKTEPDPGQGVESHEVDAPASGVLSGPSWPAAFDGIVSRWIEARREPAEGR